MTFDDVLLLFGFAFFYVVRVLTYLHAFQQDDYSPKRLLLWIVRKKSIDIKASSTIVVLLLLMVNNVYLNCILGVLFSVIAFFEKNQLRKAKKKLVLTSRARRIFYGTLLLGVAFTLLYVNLQKAFLVIHIQSIPLYLIAAYYLLLPVERYINSVFRNEAIQKLKEINPLIVGITGSYGKTSFKHMLGHILGTLDSVLFTPGSVNTEMGIVRIIRERLNKSHKFFLVEMGAYRVGSIFRLCKLTKPMVSVITAIDVVHYERFKSIIATAIAKLEVAHATINSNGKVFIMEKMLDLDPVRALYEKNPENFVVCDRVAKVVKSIQMHTGLKIEFLFNDTKYECQVPIYGICHVSSILMAFVFAVDLGFNELDILVSLKNLPQIPHRMEVKHYNNYTLIDNAYSSNPEGVKSSLILLDVFCASGGRRIMVTPGMIELGKRHEIEHENFARLAVEHTDIVIVVQPKRIMDFVNTYLSKKSSDQQMIFVSSFSKANLWMDQNIQKNDVILLENDLLDIYENSMTL